MSSHELLQRDAAYRARFVETLQRHSLYVELSGAGVNPRDSGRSVAQMVEAWQLLFPLAVEVGSPILNTCFGLYQERMMTSPTFAEQLDMTRRVRRELASMAEDYGVIITMELHVDLTANELCELIEAVNSPFVRVNLDTANALGMLEDPVEAARILAPYAKTTHYKDTYVYLTDEGYNWQGAPLWGLAWWICPQSPRSFIPRTPRFILILRMVGALFPFPSIMRRF